MMMLTNITIKRKIVVGVTAYAVIKRRMGKTAGVSVATQNWHVTINKYVNASKAQQMQTTVDMFQNNPALQMLNQMKANGSSEKQILAACKAKNSLFRQLLDPQIHSVCAVPPISLKNLSKGATGWLNHHMFSYYDERIKQRVHFAASHDDNTVGKVTYMDQNGNLVITPTEFVSKTDINGNVKDQFLWAKARVFSPDTWKPIPPTAAQKKFMEDNMEYFTAFTINSLTYIHGPAGTGYYYKKDKYGTVVRVYEEKFKVIHNYF